jgi:hypothetical protein
MVKAKLSVEEEALAATAQKPCGKKEDRQDYLRRMVKASNAIEDDDYQKLSDPLTDWMTDAVKAYDAEEEIPEFPGVKSAKGDDEESEEDETEEGEESDETGESEEDDEVEEGDDPEEKEPEEDDEPEEEEEKPVKKKPGRKPVVEEPEDEEAPVKKKPPRKSLEDDDEKPAKKAAAPAPLTDAEKKAKKDAIAYLRRLVVKNTKRTHESVVAIMAKKGHKLDGKLSAILYADALAVITIAEELGYYTIPDADE